MLYYLFRFLEQFGIPGAHMWGYISFRSLLALILSLIISAWFGEKFIKYLKSKQITRDTARRQDRPIRREENRSAVDGRRDNHRSHPRAPCCLLGPNAQHLPHTDDNHNRVAGLPGRASTTTSKIFRHNKEGTARTLQDSGTDKQSASSSA